MKKGHKPVFVPLRSGAVDPNALIELMRKNPHSLAYFQPEHNNWTGGSVPYGALTEIIRAAELTDSVVILDGAYRYVNFNGIHRPVPKELVPSPSFVMLGTGSKEISPSIRLGYAIACGKNILRIKDVVEGTMVHTSVPKQRIAQSIYSDPEYPQYLRDLGKVLQDGMEAARASIEDNWPQEAEICTLPRGGLCLAAGVKGVDQVQVHKKISDKVAFFPAGAFWLWGDGRDSLAHYARFAYSTESPAKTYEGLKLVGMAYKEEMGRKAF